MLNLTPARESREELNIGGSDNFEVQCDLCNKAFLSEWKLKVNKAKWHTKYHKTTWFQIKVQCRMSRM